ncbi:MAG: flagellar basal body-associated FliL family protein [Spirochaetota bacterium]
MSDEEQSFDEGISGEPDVAVGGKVGFLPGIVIKLLKWAAIAVVAIIFIVTVVIITMSIMNKGSKSQSYAAVTPEYQGTAPILDYYTNIEEIRGRTADKNPVTVIVKVSLGYDQGNKAIQGELIQRTPKLKDMIRGFFSSKTAEELGPKNEEALKMALKELLNRVMTTGKIKDVIFSDFNVVEF